MRLASLNPLPAIGRYVAQHSSALLHDALRGVGTAVHAAEGRICGFLRDAETRLMAAGTAREDRILAEIGSLRAEVADFRARHAFVGDPVAKSPAIAASGDRLVPRRETGLPPGRPHP